MKKIIYNLNDYDCNKKYKKNVKRVTLSMPSPVSDV